MFKHGRNLESKLIICVIMSVALLLIERSNNYMAIVKGQASIIFTPIYVLANIPNTTAQHFYERTLSNHELLKENKKLKFEKLELKGMLQQFTSVKQENQRLRKLLKSSEKVSDKLLVAELLHATTEPGTQQFILNQGTQQSVFVGQAVIDANGVIGQVLSVNPFNSRVLLITDVEHAIPVEILRNNYRAIASGMGSKEYLELINVPNTVDIIIGDLLVTSGLGKRFPGGYPVGKVIFIDKNPSLPFAKIIIEPMAKINQIKEVLLVWPGSKVSYTKNLEEDEGEGLEPSTGVLNSQEVSNDRAAAITTSTETLGWEG